MSKYERTEKEKDIWWQGFFRSAFVLNTVWIIAWLFRNGGA